MSSTQPFPASTGWGPNSPVRSEHEPHKHNHPYPIRTTSSSLLTRSNSTGSRHRPTYSASSTSASPALGRAQARGHKYSKSSTHVVPPPLPAPSSPSPSSANPPSPSPVHWRLKRSETLPSLYAKPEGKPDEVPPNPKLWTARHLAEYLSIALRPRGGGMLPLPVIRDVTNFVVESRLTGRAFLRLNQDDLDDMGINQLWKDSLLTASRTLRQNLVQGRIWGFGSTLPEEDVDAFPLSSSSFPPLEPGDLSEPFGPTNLVRSRSGRVKNLVASIERHASASSDSASSADEGSVSASDDEAPYSSNDDALADGDLPNLEVDMLEARNEGSHHSEKVPDVDRIGTSPVPITSNIPSEADECEEADKTICSLTSSLLPQTPPPVYAARAPSDNAAITIEASPAPALNISGLQSQAEQPCPPVEDHARADSPELADLVEALADEPQSGSWGTNAWEQAAELQAGSTARRIHDPIGDAPIPPQKNGAQKSLVGLFNNPPPLPLPSPTQAAGAPTTTKPDQPSVGPLPTQPDRPDLDELIRRLEQVEARLDELERLDAEWEEREEELKELRRLVQAKKAEVPADAKEQRHSREASHEPKIENPTENQNDPQGSSDPTAAGLPSYLFLVSLGVCTVVARVVFRAIVNRRVF